MNDTINGFLRATATPEKTSLLNRAFDYVEERTDQADELEMILNTTLQQADISSDSLTILNSIVAATSQVILSVLTEFGLSFDTTTPLDVLMDTIDSLVTIEELSDEQLMYVNTSVESASGVDYIELFADLVADYSPKPNESTKSALYPHILDVKEVFFTRIKSRQEAAQVNNEMPTSVVLDNRKLTSDNIRKFFEFANTEYKQTKTLAAQLLQSGLDINYMYDFYLSSFDPEEFVQAFKTTPDILAIHLYSLVIITDAGRTDPLATYTALVNKIGITPDADAIVTNHFREVNSKFDTYKKQTT